MALMYNSGRLVCSLSRMQEAACSNPTQKQQKCGASSNHCHNESYTEKIVILLLFGSKYYNIIEIPLYK